MTTNLDRATADHAWWQGIFGPLGYTITGWTFRNTAQGCDKENRYHPFDCHLAKAIEAHRAKITDGLRKIVSEYTSPRVGFGNADRQDGREEVCDDIKDLLKRIEV